MKKWRIDRKSGNENSRGFILADLMIGIAILVIALLFLSLAFRQSTVTTAATRNYQQGLYYAHQALEQLKVYDGASYASKNTSQWAAIWNTGPLTIAAASGMPAFTVQTIRMEGGEEPAVITGLTTQMKTLLVPVRATVSWTEASGASAVTKSLSAVGYYYLTN